MTNRLAPDSCLCETGYYDKLVSSVNKCLLCPERYSSCNNENSGIACKGANRKLLADECVCLDKHYEDPDSDGCLPCQYPCDSCTTLTSCVGKYTYL